MQRLIQKTTLTRAKTSEMMKTFALTLAMLLFTLGSHATVITVDNNPNSPADYTDLQKAIDSSSSGDTLYVHGSNNGYGDITIKHALTLVGAGFNPDNQWQLTTNIGKITLEEKSGITGIIDDASGTRIIGIHFNTIEESLSSGSSLTITNIHITRCTVHDEIILSNQCSDWVFYNNVIRKDLNLGGQYSAGATNVVIKNNVIGDSYMAGKIEFSNQTSVLVTNNIIHYSSGSKSAVKSCDYLTFTNNILINCNVGSGTTNEFCTFKNNITNTSSPFVYGNNTGSGNMVNTNPLLVDISNGADKKLLNDYTLQSGSPAIDAGTDTTDIGITGGANPFTVYGQDMPAFPQVIKMNILNMNVPVNDTLQIEIRARNQE